MPRGAARDGDASAAWRAYYTHQPTPHDGGGARPRWSQSDAARPNADSSVARRCSVLGSWRYRRGPDGCRPLRVRCRVPTRMIHVQTDRNTVAAGVSSGGRGQVLRQLIHYQSRRRLRGETARQELAGAEAPPHVAETRPLSGCSASVRRASLTRPCRGAPGAASRGERRSCEGSPARKPRPTPWGRPHRLFVCASTLEWRGASYYRASKRPRVRPCAATASGPLVEDSSTTPQQAHGARRPDSRRPTTKLSACR